MLGPLVLGPLVLYPRQLCRLKAGPAIGPQMRQRWKIRHLTVWLLMLMTLGSAMGLLRAGGFGKVWLGRSSDLELIFKLYQTKVARPSGGSGGFPKWSGIESYQAN